jgi:hypothetical protein
MHKMFDSGKLSQRRRRDRLARTGSGLNILINVVGLS